MPLIRAEEAGPAVPSPSDSPGVFFLAWSTAPEVSFTQLPTQLPVTADMQGRGAGFQLALLRGGGGLWE